MTGSVVNIGMRFGRLVVLAEAPRGKNRTLWFRVLCDCGTVKVVRKCQLADKTTKSCGCLRREVCARIGASSAIHGASGGRDSSGTYKCWVSIKNRCYGENDPSYPAYGGRGITMHEEWQRSFQAFLRYVGQRPSKDHSIDRYPNQDGNYEPGNVRWADDKEQNRNKRNNVHLVVNGLRLTIAEWAEKYGLKDATLRSRLKQGWSQEEALFTPVQAKALHQPGAAT